MSAEIKPVCPLCGWTFDHDAPQGQLYRCAHCHEFFRVGEKGQAALREQSTAGVGPKNGITNPEKAPKEVLWVVVAVSAGLATLVSGYLSMTGVNAGSVLRAQTGGIIAALAGCMCCYGLWRTFGGDANRPRRSGSVVLPLFVAVITLPLWFVVARKFFCFAYADRMSSFKVWLLRNTHLRYETICFWDVTDCTALEYTIVFVLEFFVFYILWKISSLPGSKESQR